MLYTDEGVVKGSVNSIDNFRAGQLESFTTVSRWFGLPGCSRKVSPPAFDAHSAHALSSAALTAFKSASGRTPIRFSNRTGGSEPMPCTLALSRFDASLRFRDRTHSGWRL